ncbi:hypothetical protein [Pseudomonas sp. NPDC086566]|uniref:hypothetical protein n=1 Tax=Pseudomonas sp. NPDC086566 TaxID=3390647 RepID=UPI003D08BF1B
MKMPTHLRRHFCLWLGKVELASGLFAGKPAPTGMALPVGAGLPAKRPGQAYAEGNPPKARRNASSHSNCSFESGEQGLFIVVVLVEMAVLSEAV